MAGWWEGLACSSVVSSGTVRVWCCVVKVENCFPRDLTAIIQAAITAKSRAPTMGVLKAMVPKVMSRPWWIRDPPDFPSLDPTPSMAALPFSLLSLESGIKASSFVASKNVYFDTRAKQFCIEPKKTPKAKGVVPKRAVKFASPVSLNSRKEKNAIPVVIKITGEMSALLVQLSFRITVPTNMLTTVATTPIIVRT